MNDNERELDLALAEAEQENRLLRARNERLEKELAEQPAQQEPDYWLGYGLQAYTEKPFDGATPVWTSPQPPAQPLTDDKYEDLVEDLADWSRYVEVDTAHQSLEAHVREVLTAHGITKGNT